MKITVMAKAKATAKKNGWNITEDTEYPVLKIGCFDDWTQEGKITIIDDNGEMIRITTKFFTFKMI